MESGAEIEEASPPDEKAAVRPYDFRTANRFSKEQMRTFNIVFDGFAQLFSNRMTAQLRTIVDCEIGTIEELSFNEFNNGQPSPVILAVMQSPPMAGQLLMSLFPDCAYMIINRLLGGTVSGIDSSKPFSDIDLAMIDRVLNIISTCFSEAWERILELDTIIEHVVTSMQDAQIASLNEATIVVPLTIKIGDEEGFLSFCIPHTAIEPIAKALQSRNYFTSSEDVSEELRQRFTEVTRGRLRNANVDLTAYFRDTLANVRDIVSLRAGDVIRLEHKVSEPLFMRVSHIPKFRVLLGKSGKNYAVKISEIIYEEKEKTTGEGVPNDEGEGDNQ
jgi:flagellar motor switch protein FliM